MLWRVGQILAHELVGASLSVVVRRGKEEPRLGRALARRCAGTALLHLSVRPDGRRRGVLRYGRHGRVTATFPFTR